MNMSPQLGGLLGLVIIRCVLLVVATLQLAASAVVLYVAVMVVGPSLLGPGLILAGTATMTAVIACLVGTDA